MLETSTLKQKLSELYSKYINVSQQMLDLDYKKKLSELKPGQKAPEQYRFFFPEDREALDEQLGAYREECRALLDDATANVKKLMTDAPSDDAVNYLTVMKLKSDITVNDIENALERYGDNYTAYNAIKGIAIENEIRGIDEHILDGITRGLDDITAQVNRINAVTVEIKGASRGSASMFDMMLDMSIPDYRSLDV